MQRAAEDVHVDEAVGRYIVDLVTATRAATRCRWAPAPGGTLALAKLGRARAVLQGR